MSQSATLYRITKEDFDKIVEQQDNLDSVDTKAIYETFAGTHEGLKFVLSKFGNDELIEQIFYPKTFIGNEVDYNNMDDEAFESLSRRVTWPCCNCCIASPAFTLPSSTYKKVL